MKKASKVMYVLAIIFNCFSFFVVIGMFAGAYIMKHYPSQVAHLAVQYNIQELDTTAEVLAAVTPVIIAAIVALVVSIVLLIFGIRAMKALEKSEQNTTPHIVMIVLSALCGELFYLLGSIFGTINASRVQQAQTPPPEENKAE